MRLPREKSGVVPPVSKQEDCLRQLVALKATPQQMLWGMLIFNCPAIIRSIGFAIGTVLAASFGVWKWYL